MSNFNQRGPMGDGPMTGRKMGRCTNYGAARNNQINQENEITENPINDNPQGRGLGRGIGRRGENVMGNDIGQNCGGRGMGRSGGGVVRGMGMGRRFRGDIQE